MQAAGPSRVGPGLEQRSPQDPGRLDVSGEGSAGLQRTEPGISFCSGSRKNKVLLAPEASGIK